jgi:hypothetical protein
VHQAFDLGELIAIVDAGEHVDTQRDGRDALACVAGEGHDVGEIELLLRVVRRQRRDRLGEERHVRRVDAGVDLAHRALVVGAQIAVLAHLEDPAALAQYAAVTGRVGDDARREGERRGQARVVEGLRHRAELVGAEERDVSVEDQRPHGIGGNGGEPDPRGVARSALTLLDHGPDEVLREGAREVLFDRLAPVTHDDDDLSAPGVESRLDSEVNDR